jgi:thiol-disulfide isomerase/thioredoxin
VKGRDEFPRDYFAHRAYQDASMSRGVYSASVQGEYRAMRDLHPDDPFYITLYARAITGTKTPEAIAALETALSKDPRYAYAHLKLAEIYTSPVFRDDAKLRAHLLAYRKGCPTTIAAYTMASRLDDAEFLKESAAGLRSVLEKRSDQDAVAAYNTLWTMEFKAVPLSEQGKLRERVRADVAKLRTLDVAKNLTIIAALIQGYKTVGDAEGVKWAEAQMPPNHSGGGAAMEAISKWRRDNLPKAGGNYQDYQTGVAKQAEAWIRQWPDDPTPRAEKFLALRGQRDARLEDVVKAAEDWLRVYEAHPELGSSPYNSVAQFYASKNMRYDELPSLLEKALKDVKDPPPASMSDLVPARNSAQVFANVSRWSTWSSAAGTYVKLKQYDKAKELIAKLGASLKETQLPPTASATEKQQYGIQEGLYWDVKAQVARAEDHKLDALIFQKNSYLTHAFPAAGLEDYRLTQVKNAWKELNGGTEEGFEAFMHPSGEPEKAGGAESAKLPTTPAVASTAGRWTTMEKPLPDFQFSDADGKTWKLADLKGKVTLINLWATWCGPCRAELPYLQKVYNKVRERKDVQVITFNTDDSRGLILPFLAENKFTFPVVPALDYVRKLVPELSIPRNWIIDADGVLRSEAIGFGAGDDQWVDDMVAVMEKARK